jgi:hypothetical protein
VKTKLYLQFLLPFFVGCTNTNNQTVTQSAPHLISAPSEPDSPILVYVSVEHAITIRLLHSRELKDLCLSLIKEAYAPLVLDKINIRRANGTTYVVDLSGKSRHFDDLDLSFILHDSDFITIIKNEW